MSKRQLPRDIIEHWPEVFKDVDIKTIPLDYLSSLRLEFTQGRIWEVDCNAKRSTGTDLDKTLKDLFAEYGNEIVHVDFRLNTAKVKRDVQKRTNAFMKKPTK